MKKAIPYNPQIFFHNIKGKEFAFIHINKTAGTSVLHTLGIKTKHHFSVRDAINNYSKERWEKAFTFAFTRNPWAKVVSHYNHRVNTNQTELKENNIPFSVWVKKTYGDDKDLFYYDKPLMFQPQYDWLVDNEGEININFIGRFENIEEDFAKLTSKLGFKKTLKNYNSSKLVNYKDYYNSETAKIIEKHFAKDIEYFKYQF